MWGTEVQLFMQSELTDGDSLKGLADSESQSSFSSLSPCCSDWLSSKRKLMTNLTTSNRMLFTWNRKINHSSKWSDEFWLLKGAKDIFKGSQDKLKRWYQEDYISLTQNYFICLRLIVKYWRLLPLKTTENAENWFGKWGHKLTANFSWRRTVTEEDLAPEPHLVI